jgi:hypothetical protein
VSIVTTAALPWRTGAAWQGVGMRDAPWGGGVGRTEAAAVASRASCHQSASSRCPGAAPAMRPALGPFPQRPNCMANCNDSPSAATNTIPCQSQC